MRLHLTLASLAIAFALAVPLHAQEQVTSRAQVPTRTIFCDLIVTIRISGTRKSSTKTRHFSQRL